MSDVDRGLGLSQSSVEAARRGEAVHTNIFCLRGFVKIGVIGCMQC